MTVKIIDVLKRIATDQNPENTQNGDPFSNYQLVRATQEIGSKDTLFAAAGEYVLMSTDHGGSGKTWIYSNRTESHASVASSVVETVDQDLTVPEKRYEILLSNAGNPDFGQNPEEQLWGTEPAYWSPVLNAKEASEASQKYIGENDLGGGNWTGGQVRCVVMKRPVAQVSYNGRVWPFDPKPDVPNPRYHWNAGIEELHDLKPPSF